jgi:hypothetical protein
LAIIEENGLIELKVPDKFSARFNTTINIATDLSYWLIFLRPSIEGRQAASQQ